MDLREILRSMKLPVSGINDDLINQLPSPFLLLGDFNDHNHMWGSNIIDGRGKIIENFMSKNIACIFNNTKSHTSSGSYTYIDL